MKVEEGEKEKPLFTIQFQILFLYILLYTFELRDIFKHSENPAREIDMFHPARH